MSGESVALWAAVDRLASPARVLLTREDGSSERVVVASLFDQLVTAIEPGTAAPSHGVQGSRAPLDVVALALLIEIADTVRSGCWNWRLKRTFDTPRDLRQVAAAVIGYGDAGLVQQTADLVWTWGSRIKSTISADPDRTWRMHGAACRVCRSTTVAVFAEDGTESRQPAMIVHSEDGVISWVDCDFCGSKLTGDELTALVLDARRRA